MEIRLSDVARNQEFSAGRVARAEGMTTRSDKNYETNASICDALHRKLSLWGLGGFAYIQIPHIGSFDFSNPIRINRGLTKDVETKFNGLDVKKLRKIVVTTSRDRESDGYFHALAVSLESDERGNIILKPSLNDPADYICCLTWSPQNQLGCFLLSISGDESANVLRRAYALCDQAHDDLSRVQALRNTQKHMRSALTAREKSIMELVVHGKNTPAIASILNLSPHTVSKYIQHVVLKLNVENRIAASLRVVAEGLIDY